MGTGRRHKDFLLERIRRWTSTNKGQTLRSHTRIRTNGTQDRQHNRVPLHRELVKPGLQAPGVDEMDEANRETYGRTKDGTPAREVHVCPRRQHRNQRWRNNRWQIGLRTQTAARTT